MDEQEKQTVAEEDEALSGEVAESGARPMETERGVFGAMAGGALRRVGPWALLFVLTVWTLGVLGGYKSTTAKLEASKPIVPPSIEASVSAALQKARAAEKAKAKTVKKVPPARQKGKTVVVNIEGLMFRSEPKRDGAVIDILEEGHELELVSQQDGWLKCTDGVNVGWVAARYVKVK